MKVEVRNDSVVISGYVNAVERWSKPLKGNLRGMMMRFIEKIKAGTFKNALKRNNSVKVLLNHDPDREIANTSNGTAILEEDNIGLRAEATITDPEVVEKAKNNKLVGWSFGFYSNADDVDESGKIATRTVTDMDLVEVSILDDTRSPAYNATSIEARSEGGEVIEIRENTEEETEEAEVTEVTEVTEATETEQTETEATEAEARETEAEETKPEAIDYSEQEERLSKIKAKSEKRSIDYSAYEERLAKIKSKPEH